MFLHVYVSMYVENVAARLRHTIGSMRSKIGKSKDCCPVTDQSTTSVASVMRCWRSIADEWKMIPSVQQKSDTWHRRTCEVERMEYWIVGDVDMDVEQVVPAVILPLFLRYWYRGAPQPPEHILDRENLNLTALKNSTVVNQSS